MLSSYQGVMIRSLSSNELLSNVILLIILPRRIALVNISSLVRRLIAVVAYLPHAKINLRFTYN